MNPSAIPAGEHAVVPFRTDDIDELARAAKGWCRHYEQLAPGPFRGQFNEVRIGGIQLFKQAVNRPMRVAGMAPPRALSFVIHSGPWGCGLWRGRPLAPNHLLVLGAGCELDRITPTTFEFTVITVDRALLMDAADALAQTDIESKLITEDLLTLPAATAKALRSHLRNVFSLATAPPTFLSQMAVKRAVQECVLIKLVDVIRSASSSSHPRFCRARRYRALKQAEDYLLAHVDEHVSIIDLCLATGVSDRVLRYVFEDTLGMSPMRYLKVRRLNGVRRALKAADPATNDVTTIAGKWGLWHLGHFSADYKGMFGELPSETLRCVGD